MDFLRHKGVSMEFHRTLNVPWNLKSRPNSMEFHGIFAPWTKIPMNPWKFYGTWQHNQIPWNSMELWKHHVHWHSVPFDFHAIFPAVPWNLRVAKSNGIEFNGIPWNWMIGDLNYIGFLWTSLELSIEVHGTVGVAISNITKIHGIHRE